MVITNPPPAEPVLDPGGVNSNPPFEMGVADLDVHWFRMDVWVMGVLWVLE